jgi:hypothetical protein
MQARSGQVVAPTDPRAEYTCRLEGYRALENRQERWETIVGNARVVVALIEAVLVYGVFVGGWLDAPWLLLPLLIFGSLVVIHERVLRRIAGARCCQAYYARGLARLDGRWAGTGQAGERFQDENHPYALDLDLFGKGSLFELLSTARLRTGEDALASWLLHPAGPEEVRARQAAVVDLRPRLNMRERLALLAAGVPRGVAAVVDLRPRLNMRERLALLAAGVPRGVDLDGLVTWGAASSRPPSRWLRRMAFVLPALAFLTLIGWLAGQLPGTFFVVILFTEISFNAWVNRWVRGVLDPVERRARDLELFAGILVCLEREDFTAPRLTQLQGSLYRVGQPPSAQIARLRYLVDLLNSRRNQLFGPVAFLLLWTTHLAFALEAWRRTSGPAIASWLDAVADFEALCALAAFAYENPTDTFPEVVQEGSQFEGEGLGHPLVSARDFVRNDVRLDESRRLLIVSGSNMSGKSTFLRCVGINAVLALAGSAVPAQRLRLSPLAVGATLRIQDSLQAGRSRFFAEITRLRQLSDLARGPRPLLFLLDELLHGTNSHDRAIGGEAVIRGLLRRGAIGLITTHDLALTDIAERLAPQAGNVHFADDFNDGAMTFDYRLRPGVVGHSNALALMRSVGLEVDS